MKEFNIKIDGYNIFINNELHQFAATMDIDDMDDDLNKKAILALANEMGYEPVYLFEEMADRLHEIVEEVDKTNKKVKLKLSSLYLRLNFLALLYPSGMDIIEKSHLYLKRAFACASGIYITV